ncbi:hypothetical protein HYR99_27225 [Candidatus Poribacteria bacterium]|nr:hypothetical protein [Candidatus Poribacteria bacterium]
MKKFYVFIILMSLIFFIPGCTQTSDSQNKPVLSLPLRRSVIVLEDITGSYPFHEQARAKTLEIVNALGPGDDFLFIQITGAFSPEKNVRLQCRFPEVPTVLFHPVDNISLWKEHQAKFNAIWAAVEKQKRAIANWLGQPVEVQKGGGTDILNALQYCAQRFEKDEEAEKYLYLFSDLIHEVGGRKFVQPSPAWSPIPLKGVQVKALFVPWTDAKEFQGRQSAWHAWMDALSFGMFDPAESQMQPLLPPSGVPRKIPSPFNN